MRESKKILIIVLSAILFLIMFLSASPAESIGPDLLLNGECHLPVTVLISSPQYKLIDRFSAGRRDELNRLLKHLAISVTVDESLSETALLVDREPVWSSFGTDGMTFFSFGSGKILDSKEETVQDGNTSLITFLDSQFYVINRMLDELYPVFEKTAGAFHQYAKTASAALTFKGYGKGVRRITITIPEQYVRNSFPGTIADLAESDECRLFLNHLVFSGSQKITLLYDQENRPIRITYDGIAGFSGDSLRKVSLQWRCLRKTGLKKDSLSMKTPSRDGNDRYNFSYEREVSTENPAKHILFSDLQIDQKEGKAKKKTEFRAELNSEGSTVGGKISFTETEDGEEHLITIAPSLKKENDSEYSGTIEINHYSGKIVTSSIGSDIHVSAGGKFNIPDNVSARLAAPETGATDSGTESVQDEMNRTLIRRMLTLPEEDLEFLRKDIPEDVWNTLAESLK